MEGGNSSSNRESNAQGDEYHAGYWPLYIMIEKNEWQGMEDFVKQTKKARSSKDAQQIKNYGLYWTLCSMIETNDWQGAEDLVKQKKEAQSSGDAEGEDEEAQSSSSEDAQKDEHNGRYWPLRGMIEQNDWQGVEDFVKQTKEAKSSKDALYRRLCKMIEMNDWQGAEDLVKEVKEVKEAKCSEYAQREDEVAQSSKDALRDEYYGRYWPLYRMIRKNDWQGVEGVVNDHPDALTAKFKPSGSIFELNIESLVDAESDEAACLIDKLASRSMDVSETLARHSVGGETVQSSCAIIKKSKGLKSSREA